MNLKSNIKSSLNNCKEQQIHLMIFMKSALKIYKQLQKTTLVLLKLFISRLNKNNFLILLSSRTESLLQLHLENFENFLELKVTKATAAITI